MKLVTIPFSHFNTRAKWALEHHGIEYQELRYMPIFHGFGVLRHTRGRNGRKDRVSTPLSTPALVLDDGEVLADSSDILAWADANSRVGPEQTLYPEEQREEILAFEKRLHDQFGAHARRVAYANGLARTSVMRASARHNVGSLQASLFWVAAPVVGMVLRRALDVNSESGRRSREIIARRLEDLGAWLEDRDYCFAGRFTAADLTLACMLAPVVRPSENYGAWLPDLAADDPEVGAYMQEARETVAGRHALRMFATHRLRAARR